MGTGISREGRVLYSIAGTSQAMQRPAFHAQHAAPLCRYPGYTAAIIRETSGRRIGALARWGLADLFAVPAGDLLAHRLDDLPLARSPRASRRRVPRSCSAACVPPQAGQAQGAAIINAFTRQMLGEGLARWPPTFKAGCPISPPGDGCSAATSMWKGIIGKLPVLWSHQPACGVERCARRMPATSRSGRPASMSDAFTTKVHGGVIL